jgi:hypothetical protein
MARSNPTQHAFFVRHVDGREKAEVFHHIILRRVIYDELNKKSHEDLLCDAQLNHIPSQVHQPRS